jgi:hypothetical protein
MRVFCGLLILALCGCPTPYRRATTWNPQGYSDAPLGAGRHLVQFRGNRLTSEISAAASIHRRAAELCPLGYEVESGGIGEGREFVPVYNQRTQTWESHLRSVPEGAVIVRCDASTTSATGQARR